MQVNIELNIIVFLSQVKLLLTYLINGLMTVVNLLNKYQRNRTNELNRLRISTGRRQTTWLCASEAEELNQGLPGSNPADGQSGT